jgi:hypothetical protein
LARDRLRPFRRQHPDPRDVDGVHAERRTGHAERCDHATVRLPHRRRHGVQAVLELLDRLAETAAPDHAELRTKRVGVGHGV